MPALLIKPVKYCIHDKNKINIVLSSKIVHIDNIDYNKDGITCIKNFYLIFSLAYQPTPLRRAEFLFEQKDYSGAVKGFLKDTQINDARVFPFLQHCQQNSLINPDNLDEQVRTAWVERIRRRTIRPDRISGWGSIFTDIPISSRH